jgi:hypothetical protein
MAAQAPGSGVASRFRRSLAAGPILAGVIALAGSGGSGAAPPASAIPFPFEVQSLDGSGNNRADPGWGRAGNQYARRAPANYADGRGQPVGGPAPRYVSNRIFNDAHQDLFSENHVSQWGFVWGQFLDHTFGLRLGAEPSDPPGEVADIPFDPADPLEEFANDLGAISFTRSTAAPGTGLGDPRQQVNTVSSYLDAWAVYGGSRDRLEWLREGPLDGDLGNNGARLLLPGGYLPRRDARGELPVAAPVMGLGGRLLAQPGRAAVAGDTRANENPGLLATHTLFAREHNRIVSRLPDPLTEEEKFQLARRVVIAEQQYITYQEFLPAMGVVLPAYTGYDPAVDTDLGNEFATVGYRAHSFVHGDVALAADLDRYSPAELAGLAAHGLEVVVDGDQVEIAVPLNLAFFNPDLVEALGLGPVLRGLGRAAQYKNDELIDNQLRSVLFQIPVSGNPACLDGPGLPECYDAVADLGAIDIARGRDHGMPSYNQLRVAYGLPPAGSFTEITGEPTEALPPRVGIDDPASLAFTGLSDRHGDPVPLGSDEVDPTAGARATTLAARLRAVYGTVDPLDAFTGMLAERHPPWSEFGELQLAIWTREFANLRDGDRFFYGNDPGLSAIHRTYGIDFRRSLADLIADNTDLPRSELSDNMFLLAEEPGGAACHVAYRIAEQWPGGFRADVSLTNTSARPLGAWRLAWQLGNGQRVATGADGRVSQDGPIVTVRSAASERSLPPGATRTGIRVLGTWDGTANPAPPNRFTLNGARCSRGQPLPGPDPPPWERLERLERLERVAAPPGG